MKKAIVTLLIGLFVCAVFASCSSHKCDAYKSSHRYSREIIR
ncbi:MAG: hypothetical protein SPK52_00710 [Synergistales bacterium]|nr:hypothetical protein [Bacteroidales bacterium]MDY6434719.1 hypothetical protein [Synergistales bacterium]MDY6393991.1 hypothetical protein [Bacteroidales bacterium]MDY6394809.1 hypothetical protein [Bacteroidales bacterium]MDY6403513.1 hypothetical protein [Bacteroidales bacterium]